MKITNIYNRFAIPKNLSNHMLTVAGVVDFIRKNWIGKEIVDWDFIIKMCLVHNLGNIVKFDFDVEELYSDDILKDRIYWKNKQIEVIKKYGDDDHEVTKKMLIELGTGEKFINTILKKSFGNSVVISESENWPLLLLQYADLRVLPFGVGSLDDRIEDLKNRMPKYANRPDFDELVWASRTIEKKIQKNMKVSVNMIDNKNAGVNNDLLDTEF